VDPKIKTIVCRHEQNAAFIASGIGRMTGKAGVALVTSGPGCSEGDPVSSSGEGFTSGPRTNRPTLLTALRWRTL